MLKQVLRSTSVVVVTLTYLLWTHTAHVLLTHRGLGASVCMCGCVGKTQLLLANASLQAS